MQKHTKNYMEHHGYCKEDIILCEICGKVANSIHHIKYRSAGGSDEVENLIALDQTCHENAHKGLITREELINNKIK